jgi:NADPH-dependent 2,4-dienoyl-CoA reductase/sulfur reductase-like enzyme
VKDHHWATSSSGTSAPTGARHAGFDPLTVESAPWHHKAYYPGAHRLHIRVTGDLRTKRLLGAQIVGHWQAEVAKRIDVFATAIFHGMPVEARTASFQRPLNRR